MTEQIDPAILKTMNVPDLSAKPIESIPKEKVFEAMQLLEQELREYFNEIINRVRELHTPKEWENTCKTCDKTDMGERVEYPCPTIKALEGEQ